jgi:hypothetical protein
MFYQALDDLVIYQAQKHLVVQYLKTHILFGGLKDIFVCSGEPINSFFPQHILQMLRAVACILRNMQ